MNIEPCVRFGIRINPKINEKPADSRNSRPPNVTLLTVSSSQNVIFPALALPDCLLLCPSCSAKTEHPVITTGLAPATCVTGPSRTTGSSACADDDTNRAQHFVSG